MSPSSSACRRRENPRRRRPVRARWGIADWLVAFLEAVAVERRKPDVVLVTHPTPDMECLALVRRIKAQPAPPALVLMTDQNDPKFEAACEAAGVDFWLEKRHLQTRLFTFLQQRFTLKFIQPRIA